jgi:hypothetical protein
MSIGTIIVIVFVLLLVGALPLWPHARTWGYGASGAAGLVLVIVAAFLVLGR